MSSDDEPWYRRFGDLIAPAYAAGDPPVIAGQADAEVAFIQGQVIGPAPAPQRILDVGCGAGRHARRLAALGHKVTGVDCSPGLLGVARALASPTDAARWLEADARDLPFDGQFDLALSLYGGGFGVGQDDADDEAALRGIARALRPGGRLLLTATAAPGLVARFTERAVMTADDEAQPPFDLATFTTHTRTVTDPTGGIVEMPAVWRAYTTRELTLLSRLCGLRVEGVYGAAPGQWGRRPPRLDDTDLLLIAWKVEGPHDQH